MCEIRSATNLYIILVLVIFSWPKLPFSWLVHVTYFSGVVVFRVYACVYEMSDTSVMIVLISLRIVTRVF